MQVRTVLFNCVPHELLGIREDIITHIITWNALGSYAENSMARPILLEHWGGILQKEILSKYVQGIDAYVDILGKSFSRHVGRGEPSWGELSQHNYDLVRSTQAVPILLVDRNSLTHNDLLFSFIRSLERNACSSIVPFKGAYGAPLAFHQAYTKATTAVDPASYALEENKFVWQSKALGKLKD